MFRSSCLNLSGPAGIAPCLGFKYARPFHPCVAGGALLYKNPIIPHSTPSRNSQTQSPANRPHSSRNFLTLWNVE